MACGVVQSHAENKPFHKSCLYVSVVALKVFILTLPGSFLLCTFYIYINTIYKKFQVFLFFSLID